MTEPRTADVVPADLDTEAGLIGCVLTSPGVFPLVQHLVAPEHFREPLHADLWETIAAVSAAGGTPNYLKVKAAIGPAAAERDLGGRSLAQYIAAIAAHGAVPAMAEEYARTVQQYWQLRQLAATTSDLRSGGPVIPGPTLERIYAEVDKVRASFVSQKSMSATLAEAGDVLIASITADLQGKAERLASSGIRSLDREIGGGPQPSNLITAAGRTSMGKSIFGVEVALSMSDQGSATIYHSLEMSRRQIAARTASSELQRRGIRISYEQIMRRGGLDQRQAELVAGVVYEQRQQPMMIEDGGGRTIGDIAASSDRLANAYARKGKALGCVVIDHAHIVRPARAYRREDEGLKEVADGALALAKHLDCPVFLLAQCNRGPEGREDKRPGLADIRGAGAFEENSDTVIFLYRPGYYAERTQAFRDGCPDARDAFDRVRHDLEIIIDKNRAGRPNQTVRVWVDPALNAIRDR
ncbi:DnaB-like helicase C-terminal domain-containing protein [Methylobacterium sp. Leaf117]|uniref:replicative DNA helicase n=1 Tax=Methylobacterium sp. Leaf117 TaxID=1736260 RepID=UPI0006FAB5E5|nr:DnaB-like helicase C-terminal domain-containing protein [Methylobacterium sp. Leaf117]KQP82879.1 hypothetical protein ASF57_12145 [Methylobacterium sp. Leaf117]